MLYVVAIAAGLGGCLALDSLDGLTGGDAARTDAGGDSTGSPGADAGEAGTALDAPSDTPAVDSASEAANDGATETGLQDATSAGDASAAEGGDAASPFCKSLQPAPFFCDDFDEGQAVDAGWTTTAVQAPAAIALDTTTSFSSPASLLASTPASTTGTYAYLGLSPSNAVGTVHVEAEINPTLLPDDGDYGAVALLRIELDQTSGTTLALMLYFSATGVYLQEEQDAPTYLSVAYGFSATAPYGTWHKWAIDLDASASPASATISVDGTSVLNTDLKYAWTAAPAKLYVGDEYNYNNDAMNVNFDNVVVTLK